MEGFHSPADIRQFHGKHTCYPLAADNAREELTWKFIRKPLEAIWPIWNSPILGLYREKSWIARRVDTLSIYR